jgi:hypothetical protein
MRRKMTPVSLTMLQESSAGPIASPQTSVLPLTLLDSETPPIPTLLTTEADEEAEEDLLLVYTEQVSEVEGILLDLANGVVDETLPWLTEEDVAFDMDEVVVEEEEIVEEDDDDDGSSDDDESDIGWRKGSIYCGQT